MATPGSCHIGRLPPEIFAKIGEYIDEADAKAITKLREFLSDKGVTQRGVTEKGRLRRNVKVATIIAQDAQLQTYLSFAKPKASRVQINEALPSLVTEALSSMIYLSTLRLQADIFTDKQINQLLRELLNTDVLSRLSRLSISGPPRLVRAIIKGYDPSKLKALHMPGWVGSPEYRAARKHKWLEKLHLHYDRPGIPEGAPLRQNVPRILRHFKHLDSLILSEAEFDPPEIDETELLGHEDLNSILERLIVDLDSCPTLKRFAVSLRHKQFDLSYPSYMTITAWYNEILYYLMQWGGTVQERGRKITYAPMGSAQHGSVHPLTPVPEDPSHDSHHQEANHTDIEGAEREFDMDVAKASEAKMKDFAAVRLESELDEQVTNGAYLSMHGHCAIFENSS
ncbi:hypothetical protein NM208_g12068 [Fusarium decemcellulare]|uniref:Uncharacterized protein n=1 Tax=Fusarium decemcellulare TaxID=57161 RepID=A0ACC1RSV0_9HYPO|nr:hypothetical protein NM208_g12068 [Fusarium decemcellulare]